MTSEILISDKVMWPESYGSLPINQVNKSLLLSIYVYWKWHILGEHFLQTRYFEDKQKCLWKKICDEELNNASLDFQVIGDTTS